MGEYCVLCLYCACPLRDGLFVNSKTTTKPAKQAIRKKATPTSWMKCALSSLTRFLLTNDVSFFAFEPPAIDMGVMPASDISAGLSAASPSSTSRFTWGLFSLS